jgi:hypothetical protein
MILTIQATREEMLRENYQSLTALSSYVYKGFGYHMVLIEQKMIARILKSKKQGA